MKNQGYSLIEILIGLALFALVAVVVNMLLFSSLKSGRKAAAITSARTEGGYVLNAILTTIKYARSIESCTQDAIRVINQDGQTLTYRWKTDTDPDSMASESGSLVSSLTSSRVAVSQPAECPGGIFSCSGGESVVVCFAVDNAGGTDTSDKAGAGEGIIFKGQATLRNE